MLTKPPSKYPILATSVVHKNPFYSIVHEKIQIHNGVADYYIVHKDEPSVFIVVYENDKILLIKQYRQQVRKEEYEIPAGRCDKGESVESTAIRELREETGYIAGTLQTIGKTHTANGLSDIVFYTLIATNLTQKQHSREYSEDICEQQFFTISDVKNMILNGDIMDGPTIAALNYFFLYQNV